MLYGLENAHNWGWDWFSSMDDALSAKNANATAYGHNAAPMPMTRDQIEADNQ